MLVEKIPRKLHIERLKKVHFDCLIIGGGATGTGTALDAALRGLNIALIEKNDFSSGTSSRSTKLIHGGVRYLAQFHFKLIREALLERKRLLTNAPHLVKPLKFILPCYKFIEKPYYSIGLTLYDFLAGDSGLPSHKVIDKSEVIREIPSINQNNLTGGITYYDSQFNDSRLNVLLARSAAKEGACVVNKIELISILKEKNKIIGAILKDNISGEEFQVKTKLIVNTAGVFIDEIRKMDDPEITPILSPSQGIHLVFHKEKVPCKSAMIIPKTPDGRVVFMIPWEDFTIIGTTDTPIQNISEEPIPLNDEIDFLLNISGDYLGINLQKKDITSVFAGLRPLISPDGSKNTKNISREEMILVSPSGLITMGGGKWSTYRKMSEDLVDKMILEGKLTPHNSCITYNYNFIGKENYSENLYLKISQNYSLNNESAKRLRNYYGGEIFDILGDKPKELLKSSGYFEEEVKHFIHNEFALTLVDVLARRFRVLFIDLELGKSLVSPISKIMAKELKWTSSIKKKREAEVLDLIKSLEGTFKG
ncbi:MAG: FAD-dependent oxidoreductase [Leptospiraceae bacterium]|nr:FAD-dependent oxidoreductase [Leptospiraceae bacterium]